MTPIERAWRGTRNDWRLHLLSIFSVAVAFVCLASAMLVVVNVHGVRARWAATGRASVFLRADATAEQIEQIQKALRQTPGVTDVRHVTSDDARREVTAQKNDDVLGALPPEAFPASRAAAPGLNSGSACSPRSSTTRSASPRLVSSRYCVG